MALNTKKVLLTYIGATGRTLEVTLTDGTNALDLSSEDYTITLSAILGDEAKIDGETCTKVVVGENDAGEDGVISYTPASHEIDVAGDYQAQFKLALSDGEASPTYTYDFSEEFVLRVQETVESRVAAEE